MEELQDGVVFRLATVKHDFPPDSSRLRFWHFELSQNDRSHAGKTGAFLPSPDSMWSDCFRAGKDPHHPGPLLPASPPPDGRRGRTAKTPHHPTPLLPSPSPDREKREQSKRRSGCAPWERRR